MVMTAEVMTDTTISEMCASHRRLRFYELQDEQARGELETIESTIRELRIQRKRMQRQRDSISLKLRREGTVCAKLCAQEFAQRFLRILPRELRDIIYEYAILTSVEHAACAIVPEAHHERWVKRRSEYGPFCLGDSHVPENTPYFLNQQWFGDQLAREATMAFYRLVTLCVAHQEDLDLCLKKDVFHTGVIPRQHIKSIDIMLTSEAYLAKDFDYKFGKDNEQDTLHLVKAVRWLDPLLGLPQPALVHTQIRVKVASKRAAAQLEELLTPLVMKLRGRGCKIFVMHDLDKEYGPYSEHTFEFPRITPLLSD